MDVQTGNSRAILRAMASLLEDCTLDQLTVDAICKQAGISRQTFYRTFPDKYAAAFWYVETLLDGTCKRIGVSLGWREGYLSFFKLVQRNALFMKRLSESNDYNSINPTTVRNSEEDFLRAYRGRYGAEPDEMLAFQMHAFARIATTTVAEWIESGCVVPAETFIDRFLSLVPRQLFEVLDIESGASDDCPFIIFEL